MKNILFVLVTLIIANFSLTAQSLIEGSIGNEQGVALTAITVQMNHISNDQLSMEITTDESGYFFIDGLTAGNYELTINHPDYELLVIDNFEFPRDTDQVLGLSLEKIVELRPIIEYRPEENNVASTIH